MKTLVSLTFDDGLDTHLDVAVPLLDHFGLKGTFYIHLASDCFGRRFREWRKVADKGHELGNHTIFHPASARNSWVTEGNAIEKYSLDRMRMELIVANRCLGMLDDREKRTFAFPCSNPLVGFSGWPSRTLSVLGLDRTRLMGWVDRWHLDVGSRTSDYTEVVRDLFVAARCGGTSPENLLQVPDDRYRVQCVEGDGLDGDQLVACTETAVQRGSWLVFAFHGIEGGHMMSCSRAAFEKLILRLSVDPSLEVVTFLEGAKRLWPQCGDV